MFWQNAHKRQIRSVEVVEVVRNSSSVLSGGGRKAGHSPKNSEALEIYLAGRHGSMLNDDRFWNSQVMRGLQDRRRTASAVLERHPSVSSEELARAAALEAPEIQRAARSRDPNDGFAVSGIIAGTLAALGVLVSLGFSLLSSMAAPGGLVARAMGLAVVTRDGTEIRRWRSLIRTLVAWLPGIVWLAWLSASPKIQGFVPVWASSVTATGLALAVLAAGAVWAIAFPVRGVHDRVAGTWVVPR